MQILSCWSMLATLPLHITSVPELPLGTMDEVE